MPRHTVVAPDALMAAARVAVSAINARGELRDSEAQGRPLRDMVYGYFETGRVTPDALADVAMLPNCNSLAVFFAQFV